jgi:cysteinyl-tRNA synthetase
LRLYNTLTREKAEFKPIDPKNVRMYVCGPTVYDFAHIGNARPVIVFDVLFRLLRHIYGADHVTYVRNITDVDDKINARAAERYPDLAPEVGIRKLTEETADQFHKDIAALGVLPPTVEPRATEHIQEMVTLCDTLVAKGHAYVAADHVLFDVSSMKDYGKLANRSLEEMEAGARVEVAPYKKGPMDFVLWKPSKPGEPAWPSPAGIKVPGRPGWHIECSAMSWKHLGEVFDIHGGGIDLAFPHHENEIAQSRCAHATPVMANVWMHNGFLQVEGEKMSKSLGNFVTIHDLLDQGWDGESLRFNMLRTHYRQPINWTSKGLQEADDKLYELVTTALEHLPTVPDPQVVAALCDDLNTPEVFARIYELEREARLGNVDSGGALCASLQLVGFASARDLGGIVLPITGSPEELLDALLMLFPRNYPFGYATQKIKALDGEDWNQAKQAALFLVRQANPQLRVGEVRDQIFKLEHVNSAINARLAARKQKDFKESDRIRDQLAAMGIALKDSKDPKTGEITTTWEIAR